MTGKIEQFSSAVAWLLHNVDRFLDVNPGLSDENFGWISVRDTSIIPRLRQDKDLTTKKMERMIDFLKNARYIDDKKEVRIMDGINTIKLTRRIYD